MYLLSKNANIAENIFQDVSNFLCKLYWEIIHCKDINNFQIDLFLHNNPHENPGMFLLPPFLLILPSLPCLFLFLFYPLK